MHGLNWDSIIHEYSFLYCFFLCIRSRLSNRIVYAKDNEKCWFLRNFFNQVIDLDHLNCPEGSDVQQSCSRSCLSHSAFFHEIIAYGRNQTCFVSASVSVSRTLMSTASQTQKNRDNLFLTLSLSLTISVSTTNQVNIKNFPENITTRERRLSTIWIEITICERQSSIYLMLISCSVRRLPIPFFFF